MTTAVASTTVTRTALLDGLSRVALVVPRAKPTIPVAMCVHIVGTEKGLRFTGTDFDRTVTTTVVADGAEEFPERVVPCHRLIAIVDRLPIGPIDLTPTASGVRLEAQRARFEVKGVGADEWPRPVHGDEKPTTVAFDAPEFLRALTRAATCCSSEQSRPILNGVHVAGGKNERLTVTGTDGFTLAREYVSRTRGPALDLIVPSTSVAAIAKLFANTDALTLTLQDSRAVVSGEVASGDSLIFETRLIHGPYPNIGPVINRPIPHTAIVDRMALLAAVRRVTALSVEKSFLVRLEWNAENVVVRGTGDEDAGSSEDVVPCAFDGNAPVRITFHPRFLIDALTLRTAETIRVGMKDGETMMALRDDGATELQNIVMPRRDRGE